MWRCKILGLLKLFLWYVPWISRASLPPSWVSLRVHHCEWLLWLKAWWPRHRLFTEIQVIFFVPCFFCDPTNVGNLISGSSAFSKSSLYIWKSLVNTLSKPSLKDFEHDLASMWNECNCVVVWTFFGIALDQETNQKMLNLIFTQSLTKQNHNKMPFYIYQAS